MLACVRQHITENLNRRTVVVRDCPQLYSGLQHFHRQCNVLGKPSAAIPLAKRWLCVNFTYAGNNPALRLLSAAHAPPQIISAPTVMLSPTSNRAGR
jgi:hypothetical protein